MTVGLSERVKTLARNPSRKIEAIGLYRRETGAGIAEAKKAVEAYIDEVMGRVTAPTQQPAGMPKSTAAILSGARASAAGEAEGKASLSLGEKPKGTADIQATAGDATGATVVPKVTDEASHSNALSLRAGSFVLTSVGVLDQFGSTAITQARCVTALQTSTPIKDLYFTPIHSCLCAEHDDGASAWNTGIWQPLPVDWFPSKAVGTLALRQVISNLEPSIHSNTVGNGRFRQFTGYEPSNVPSNAFGGVGFLVGAATSRKAMALWDVQARAWICAMTNARVTSTKFAFGNEHVALIEGGRDTSVRIARYQLGQTLDLQNPLSTIRCGETSHFQFVDQDRHVIRGGYMSAKAFEWKPQPLTIHSVTSGEIVSETQYQPPATGNYSRDGFWSFSFHVRDANRLCAIAQMYDHQKKAASVLLFDPFSGKLLGDPLTVDSGLQMSPVIDINAGLVLFVRADNVLELRHLTTGVCVFHEKLPATPVRAVFSADARHFAVQLSETELQVYERGAESVGRARDIANAYPTSTIPLPTNNPAAHDESDDKEPLLCPNCNSALSVKRDRVGTGADAGMMAAFGIEQVRLRCPKCRSVMDVSLPPGNEYE
ncbi:MAG: hypothetical protein U0935_24590 [Pirellulales bacterium]